MRLLLLGLLALITSCTIPKEPEKHEERTEVDSVQKEAIIQTTRLIVVQRKEEKLTDKFVFPVDVQEGER